MGCGTKVDHTFYYAGGQIGYLDIPKLELSVKVYEGETAANMKKGVAHIKDSSVWSGNVVLCGHNRGDSAYFNKLHTLKSGDRITYTILLSAFLEKPPFECDSAESGLRFLQWHCPFV